MDLANIATMKAKIHTKTHTHRFCADFLGARDIHNGRDTKRHGTTHFIACLLTSLEQETKLGKQTGKTPSRSCMKRIGVTSFHASELTIYDTTIIPMLVKGSVEVACRLLDSEVASERFPVENKEAACFSECRVLHGFSQVVPP